MDATLPRNPGFWRRLLASLMGGFGFSQEGARRIAAATQVVERAIKGGGPGRPRWPVIAAGGSPLVHARIGAGGMSAAAAGSASTLGSGLVTRYTLGAGTRTLGSGTETAYNLYPATVPGSKNGLFFESGGMLYLITREC